MKTRYLIHFVLLTLLFSCGNSNSTTSSSNKGFPSVSVKCGSQACVK